MLVPSGDGARAVWAVEGGGPLATATIDATAAVLTTGTLDMGASELDGAAFDAAELGTGFAVAAPTTQQTIHVGVFDATGAHSLPPMHRSPARCKVASTRSPRPADRASSWPGRRRCLASPAASSISPASTARRPEPRQLRNAPPSMLPAVTDTKSPQAKEMADESMVRTLAAQAEAIWPAEEPIFSRHPARRRRSRPRRRVRHRRRSSLASRPRFSGASFVGDRPRRAAPRARPCPLSPVRGADEVRDR